MRVDERNAILKDHRKVKLRFALAYPNIYTVGISNLGVRLLYELLNKQEEVVCERFFFSGYGVQPKSLESDLPLHSFDVVGFSLQHEMDYLKMLDMLSTSNIPLRSEERRRPVVIAGGPAVSSNPMPLSPFVDIFVVGEVEPIFPQLLDLLLSRDAKSSPTFTPGLYSPGHPTKRVYVEDLNNAYHAVRQVHPTSGEWLSTSFLLEVSRGCSKGCRFCLECFIYSPRRERSFSTIKKVLEDGIRLSQTIKVSCISSAFFDHSELKDILSYLKEIGLPFSTPSTRISDADEELMRLIASGGQRSITVAPETPSERLRRVINKHFHDDQLYNLLSNAKKSGIRSLKLYFMLGIPGESDNDLNDLEPFLSKVISSGFSPSSIHISINPLIPKSNTPFQWLPMIKKEDYDRRVSIFRAIAHKLGIRRVETLDYRWGAIQAYLSTGGPEASEVLLYLQRDLEEGGMGDLGAWRRVLKRYGERPETLYKPLKLDDPLPWEEIKGAVPISILRNEFLKATGEIR
ncbi:MAG: radical SAM protein [Candidatus Methanomethylicaceae archaeon]